MSKKIAFCAAIILLCLPFIVSLEFIHKGTASIDDWWESSWRYRRSIEVENSNPFDLVNYPTNITIDTQTLVTAGKMTPDGSDLRLLNDDEEEIDFALVDFNTPSTTLAFRTSVPDLSNRNYSLYYGSPSSSSVIVEYEDIKYEVIDEFNDGIIDPMWSFNEPTAAAYNESNGYLYIEKGPTGGEANAILTSIKINCSEILRIQFRSYSAEIGSAGYNGVHLDLHTPNQSSYEGGIYTVANTYDKSANNAAPKLDLYNQSVGGSSEINASRINWTGVNDAWHSYEVYWNKSSDLCGMTMDDTYYDNENTHGWLESYSFGYFRIGANAYSPSGTSYAKFDYVRVWQEVSIEPTFSLGGEEGFHDVAITGFSKQGPSAGQGLTVEIEVTIANLGSYDESFDIYVFANASEIGMQHVELDVYNITTLTFDWDTTSYPLGVYEIAVNMSFVPEDWNMTNNSYLDGIIVIYWLYDVTGDDYVGIDDIVTVAERFGQNPP